MGPIHKMNISVKLAREYFCEARIRRNADSPWKWKNPGKMGLAKEWDWEKKTKMGLEKEMPIHNGIGPIQYFCEACIHAFTHFTEIRPF